MKETPDPRFERSRTIETRKSKCGKFYLRSGGSYSNWRYLKENNNESERSSYYKWKP